MAEQQTVLRTLRLMRALRKRPMTIQQMFEFMKPDGVTHSRTVYRSLEVFEVLGLNVQKSGKTYFINDSKAERDFALDDLTAVERDLIKNALESAQSNNSLTASILQKLDDTPDLALFVDALVREQTEQNIGRLKEAIKQGVCVVLRRYQSLDSGGKIEDRTVEPKELHKGGQQVYCYDLKKGRMQTFSTDRIESVDILRGGAQSHDKAFEHSDVFGFSHAEARAVKLRLTERAYLILREEFPRAERYLREDGGGFWLFDGIYCNPNNPTHPILRFMASLPRQVEILQPNDLRVALRIYTEGGNF